MFWSERYRGIVYPTSSFMRLRLKRRRVHPKDLDFVFRVPGHWCVPHSLRRTRLLNLPRRSPVWYRRLVLIVERVRLRHGNAKSCYCRPVSRRYVLPIGAAHGEAKERIS